jgi:hypothetical protein
MKQRFRAITQVSLAVLLALTLGLVMAVPSIAQGLAQESASISPPTEVYDLGDPADVKTTVTWHDAGEITAVKDDGHELGENDHSVIAVDDNRATLTINASYLAGKLGHIGDNLTLAIEFYSGDPAVFTIVAVRYPAVSREEADYDLDNPSDFIETSITWGRASSITGISEGEDDLRQGLGNDYIVLLNTLLILTDYLEANLTEEGKELELEIKFDVGEPASFTIVAVKTDPGLFPSNPYAYDLFAAADVEIGITWRRATEVVSIVDDDGYSLQRGAGGDYAVSNTTLTILSSYLERKLKEKGATLALTIQFDVGDPITFITEAVDRAPSIAPERADYDLDDPAAVSTTITWEDAIEVVSIIENGNSLVMGDDYKVEDITEGKTATLTILNDYLSDELMDVDQSVELSIRFGFNSTIHPGLQHYATFNITAIGTHPSISPGVAPYDLRSPAAVNTTVTWRHAERRVSVADDGYPLQEHDDYSVTTIDADRATLTILNSYLAGNLTEAGDSLALAIGFDLGEPVTFTITAVDHDPSIDPQRADYDLDKRGNVETTITWQVPTQVISITENGNPLIMGDDYEVEDIAEGGNATLTILSDSYDSYLNRKLRDVGDEAVLTIEFSVGDPVTFTITGVRFPDVYPTALYDLDNRADFIETRITWGSASNITGITKGEHDLRLGVDNDYIVLGDTLVITDNYLRGLDIGEVAVLDITFDDDYTADFAIRVIGTHARILPTRAVYDLDDRADVQTTITWGSATEVVSITENDAENDNRLIPEDDYVVGQTVDGEATLTISKAYLEEKVERWVDEVLLTVEFDAGKNVTLSIGGLAGCFIATAAYDTAMAQEIQVLREFRDGYMLTNSVGQALVDGYYRISPPIARFITEHPGLKPIVRAGLVPAVAISSAAVNTGPAGKTAIVGLLVLISVALGIWAARRRSRRPKCT